jgi:pimeloyl-ACP methyl ester carboxylesterase
MTSIVESKPSFFLGNSAVYQFGNEKHAENAFLFFHGFPADTNKNEDFAKALAEINSHSFVLHYSGLGASNGLFSLAATIEEAKNLLHFVKNKSTYKSIYIIGHSWGGLVAINLLKQIPFQFKKAALLAPFCILPDEQIATEILEDFCINQKQNHNRQYDINALLKEYKTIKLKNDLIDVGSALKNTTTPILIIQGTHDIVSIPEGAMKLSMSLGNTSQLIEVDDEHHFINRDKIIKLLKGWFINGDSF